MIKATDEDAGFAKCVGCFRDAEISLTFTRTGILPSGSPITERGANSVLDLCHECADEARDKIGVRREVPDAAQLSLEEIGQRL